MLKSSKPYPLIKVIQTEHHSNNKAVSAGVSHSEKQPVEQLLKDDSSTLFPLKCLSENNINQSEVVVRVHHSQFSNGSSCPLYYKKKANARSARPYLENLSRRTQYRKQSDSKNVLNQQ